MRRFFSVILLLLFVFAASAAFAEYANTFEFEPVQFSRRQTLAVYSAPSTKAWRGAKGKASVDTSGTVWGAGEYNGWMMVLYEIRGGYRCGYINLAKVKGNIPHLPQLKFMYNVEARTTDKVGLTDDPWAASNNITTLKKGTAVSLLGVYRDYGYVQVMVSKKLACGFVPLSTLDLSGIELPEEQKPVEAEAEDDWIAADDPEPSEEASSADVEEESE